VECFVISDFVFFVYKEKGKNSKNMGNIAIAAVVVGVAYVGARQYMFENDVLLKMDAVSAQLARLQVPTAPPKVTPSPPSALAERLDEFVDVVESTPIGIVYHSTILLYQISREVAKEAVCRLVGEEWLS
jgi:hypothetical protein